MNDVSRVKQEGGIHTGGIQAPNDWLSPRRFSILLALLVIIPFYQVLLGGRTFVIRDWGLFSYPVAYFVKHSFLRGEIPFWNPLSYSGAPFLAQFNTLSLYPPSIIYCLLPLTWALPFFCLLHTYLAGLGMYFLARRWTGSNLGGAIAGVVFALNGLSLSMLMWPSHIAGYALMPWAVFFAESAWKKGGRDIVIAGIICALQVLTGSPEEILFAWMFMFVLAIVQFAEKQNTVPTLIGRFIAIGIIAVGLSAPSWLPFVEFAAHSQRDNSFAGSEWSMPLFGWANFLVPMYQTRDWQGLAVQISQYWTTSYYVGIAIIFLAIIAVVRRPGLRVTLLGIAALLSVLLAFGDGAYLYKWLRHAFPFLGMFRYPVKFVLLTTFVVPLMAAYAIAHFETRKRWSVEWAAGAILLCLVGLIIYMAKVHASDETPWRPVLVNALSRAGFLIAAVAALYIFSQTTRWRALAIGALIVLTWGDLLTHVPWQNPTTDSSFYQPGLAQMKVKLDPQPTIGESRLMMSPESARAIYFRPAENPEATFLLQRVVFLGNLNFLDGFAKAEGFFSLNLRETHNVLSQLSTPDTNKLERLEYLLGVSQTIEQGKVFDWVPRKSYLPLITTGQEPHFGSNAENFNAIIDPSADIKKTVYLPIEAKSVVKAKREDNARIVQKDFGYNSVSVTVDTPTPAMTLISQSYYPNWKAYIDGAPAPLWRANYAFQAVEMPAGKHVLKVVYEDRAFRFGVGLFVLTAVSCAGLSILIAKRNKARLSPA